MARKIAIIGGGIAGLSTGCYARMNGYDAEIFEMHTVPGGVCTGWKRKGYTFDGCLHFLVGTGPGNSFHRVWRELGALSGKRVHDHDVFCDIVLPDGSRLTQFSDIDRLVESLKKGGGESGSAADAHDAALLDQTASDVKLWSGLRMPLPSGEPRKRSAAPARVAARLRGMWKIRRYLPLFRRYGGSVEKHAARFHSRRLQVFFTSVNPIPEMPAMTLLMMFCAMHTREAGWPEGGSLALAESIARRYEELGGIIHYGARVERIIVRDGRAVGIRLADGSEHFADEVISAADGHATLFQMLEGKYMSRELAAAYRTLPLYSPFVQVSFGLKRDMSQSGLPRLRTVRLPRPLPIGGEKVSMLLLNNYAFDPTLAAPGRTPLTVLYLSCWDHWQSLSGDRSAYLAEKKRILADVTSWLEGEFPGISADIEVTDVATPLTTVRYTGNYHASYEGWRPTAATMRVKIDKRLPGLAGFSMVGQWTCPFAGLPTAASDGRVAIQALCAQDGKEFRTEEPAEPAPHSERAPGAA